MKVVYGKRTDTLSVVLRDGSTVIESDEKQPGIILDYDEHGNFVPFEILDASRRVTQARSGEFQMTQ